MSISQKKRVHQNQDSIRIDSEQSKLNGIHSQNFQNLCNQKHLFINMLGQKCNILMNGLQNPNEMMQQFLEEMWKNKMIESAKDKFPRLDSEQLEKLVQYNWNIVYAEHKEEIADNFIVDIDPKKLEEDLYEFQAKIKEIQQKK